jgi:N-acetylneuraminate synthase
MSQIMIGGRAIGRGHKPFVVAEMSGNHNQSLERALAIVDAAADAGAHAVKIQTFTADSMTLDLAEGDFVIADPASLWNGRKLYDLYREAATPYEWHTAIMKRCSERGMLCFSTPFDAAALEFLETLNVPAYKIASFENIDIPLIRRVAATGKPIIMSTGMATEEELATSVHAARLAGCRDLVLLKCTSSYPASPEFTNLVTLPDLRDRFSVEVGLSDHTMGVGCSVAAIAFGATVIEKHFTLSRAEGGIDAAFSLEPAEMKSLVVETERAWLGLGHVHYGPTAAERGTMKHRRSLFVVDDVAVGELFTERNVRAIRPAGGLPPRYIDDVLGKKATRAIKRGTPLSLELFE